MPRPQTYQDYVLFLVLDLPGQLLQAVQVEGGLVFPLHLGGAGEVELALPPGDVGDPGVVGEDGHHQQQVGEVGGDEVDLADALGHSDDVEVEF